jgi:hypothetical protein
MQTVILDDISFGDPAIDALFARWRAAIERANNWSVTGKAQFNAGPVGYAIHVGGGRISPRAAVVATGGISAAPNANTLGSGNVMLRWADGAALDRRSRGSLLFQFLDGGRGRKEVHGGMGRVEMAFNFGGLSDINEYHNVVLAGMLLRAY